jgi:hypothetical protein
VRCMQTVVNVCEVSTNGSDHDITFKNQWENLMVFGVGQLGMFEGNVSLMVEISGAVLMHFSGVLSNVSYMTTWEFGDIIKGVKKITFVTIDGTTANGMIDGVHVKPMTVHSCSIEFLNGTVFPCPHVPARLAPELHRVPDVIQAALCKCRLYNYTLQDGRMMVRCQNTAPFKFDNPESMPSCTGCIFESFGNSVLCGICDGLFGGVLSFTGINCGCTNSFPIISCQQPGGGCCPIGCGPTHTVLSFPVVFQCCYGGDTCLDPSNGECCPPNSSPCDGNVCCEQGIPCRDGICCPTDATTCGVPGKMTCCDAGST